MNTTVRYTDGFHEHDPNLAPHYVEQRFIFDLQVSYDFTALVHQEERPVAGYSKNPKEMARGKDDVITETSSAQTSNYAHLGWQELLKGTRITVGVDNLFDRDPPQAFGEGGNAVGYPGYTYDATGRFVYVRLVKKF